MIKLQATAYVAFAALLGLGATAPAFGQCAGDCNGDGKVEITEVVTVINHALGNTTASCPNADGPDEGAAVEVNDVVAAVNIAGNEGGACEPPIGACGNGIVEAGEDCDLGGICAGGSTSGTACTSDAACGAGEPGICDGGTGALRQCTMDAECGGGKCDRCRTFGGQPIPGNATNTCAANCTFESSVAFVLKPGDFGTGSTLLSGSGAVVHSGILGNVPLPLTGSQTFRIGKAGATGVTPLALKATDVQFPPINVAEGLACACVRGIPAKTCGGYVLNAAGALGQDCTDGFSTTACPANLPCTFVHGPGNSGQGLVGCSGLSPIDLMVSQESNGSNDPAACLTPGTGAPICADPFIIELKNTSTDPGSAIIVTHTAIGVKTGSCAGFCTDADAQSTRGTVNPLILTTGTATGVVTNVDGQDEVHNGPWSVSGNAVSCENLRSGNSTGAELSGTFTSINQNLLGDIVVEILFEAQ